MSTCFSIITGETLTKDYSWDIGIPFTPQTEQVTTSAFSTTSYISGYAPGLRVEFANNFVSPDSFYIWNFGDFYNEINNLVYTEGLSSVDHTYLVPGTYTVSLCSEFGACSGTVVHVKEIPPKASFHSLTRPVTGVNSLTVTFTPRAVIPGSFPIDQIDWNFGDGSPTQTVSRYGSADESVFTFTSYYSGDQEDPRNWNPTHTYNRYADTYPIFYPSLTAYSSTTGTYDTASITIGPISLSSIDNNFNFLKARNTNEGNLFTIENNNNLFFTTIPLGSAQVLPGVPELSPPTLIVGGNFSIFDQDGIYTQANKITRLFFDGKKDESFITGTGFSVSGDDINYSGLTPQEIIVQNNGKIIVAGPFSQYQDSYYPMMIRLNQDGSIDNTFKNLEFGPPVVGITFSANVPPSTFSVPRVNTIHLLPDYKMIVGGGFSSYNNQPFNKILKLNNDGTIDNDTPFNSLANGFSDGEVFKIIQQPDGKFLVGGTFTRHKDVFATRILRLNEDGSRDTSFDMPNSTTNGFNSRVSDIIHLKNGKIMVVGGFSAWKSSTARFIARLNSNGVLDETFNLNEAGFAIGLGRQVVTIVELPDGSFVLGGNFIAYNNTPVSNICRIDSEGNLDTTFTLSNGFNGFVNKLVLYKDKIIAVGAFSSYKGQTTNKIAALNFDGSLDTNYDFSDIDLIGQSITTNNRVFTVAVNPSLYTPTSTVNSIKTSLPSIPPNLIKDSFGEPDSLYIGNPGSILYPSLNIELDEFFNEVSLLLNFEDPINSTRITDSSVNNLLVRGFNGARVSDIQTKFGTGALLLDGLQSVMTVEEHPSLNFNTTDDFTIEGWINYTTFPGDGTAFISKGTIDTTSGYTFYYFQGQLYFGVPYVSNDLNTSFIPDINEWYFLTATRFNNTLRLFINGTLLASNFNNSLYTSSEILRIGISHSDQSLNGFVDSVRITKGVARYTSSFTPPATPFPSGSVPYY
jgi:uncharacterized delta-60 repeat protein